MKNRKRFFSFVLLLLLSSLPLLWPSSAFGEKWAFVALGDNRSAFDSYRNVLEKIKGIGQGASHEAPPVDFVLACGDISPMEKNYNLYKSVFKDAMPPYFPVRGNHENANDVKFILKSLLPLHGNRIKMHNAGSVSYYADWKNVRLIVLDQYADFGNSLDNKAALKWLENAIDSAPKAGHVFVSFHEPYLPIEPSVDAFWKVLIRHHDKVRAVVAGHYHVYVRKPFPDDETGIFYINVGAAGWTSHSDERNTIIAVIVDGESVSFKTFQASAGTTEFKVTDEWKGPKVGRDKRDKKMMVPEKIDADAH